jgi:hypothetical protein
MAVATTAVTALLSWVGIHVIGGVDLVVGSGADAITVGAGRTVASTIAVALCGWALLAVLERTIEPPRRALRLWQGVSLAVLAVSCIGPLTADAPTATRWWLLALHTTVAATFIPSMRRGTPAR